MNINNKNNSTFNERLARSCDWLFPIRVFQSCPKVTNVGAKHNDLRQSRQCLWRNVAVPIYDVTRDIVFFFEHCQSLDGFQSIEITRSFPLAENDLSFARSGMAKYSYLCVARHSNSIVTAHSTKDKLSILKRRKTFWRSKIKFESVILWVIFFKAPSIFVKFCLSKILFLACISCTFVTWNYICYGISFKIIYISNLSYLYPYQNAPYLVINITGTCFLVHFSHTVLSQSE